MMRMIIKSSFMLAAWFLYVATQVALSQTELQKNSAQWISASGTEPCPVNRFFYFRKVTRLQSLHGDSRPEPYLGAHHNVSTQWLCPCGHLGFFELAGL